jgi:hypothetical protein
MNSVICLLKITKIDTVTLGRRSVPPVLVSFIFQLLQKHRNQLENSISPDIFHIFIVNFTFLATRLLYETFRYTIFCCMSSSPLKKGAKILMLPFLVGTGYQKAIDFDVF